MRISRVHVRNLYSLVDVEVDFEDVTILVGANGTGKSALLRSIQWFVEGGELDAKDLSGRDEAVTASVEVEFSDLTAVDREAFGPYVVGGGLTLWRSFDLTNGQKLAGRGLAYPPFEEVRAIEGKRDRRAAYNRLRESTPNLGLPSVTNADAADDAMAEWERQHPDELIPSTRTANHLFGFTGGARLSGRFDYVLVAAGTDPSDASADGRGTLLRQIVERAIGTSEARDERLEELRERFDNELGRVFDDEDAPKIARVSGQITSLLAELVPGAGVSLALGVPQLRIPEYTLQMGVSDGDFDTDLDRQGHGLQRAVLFTLIRQLAATTNDGDAPGLLLAIEEPELYQHPVQARHFANTLSTLSERASGSVQVLYATHSEHFIDPSRYSRLRRFTKTRQGKPWSETTVRSVSVENVSRILDGVMESAQIELRLRRTLRRRLSEAVFSRAVLLVEGVTDGALASGVADRSGGLDSIGVSVVPCGAKTNILMPWAILRELGVPTLVLFDGDAGLEDRMTRDGRSVSDIADAVTENARRNRLLREKLGIPEPDEVTTQITSHAVVFTDDLEAELQQWPSFESAKARVAEELGERNPKSEDVYRAAAAAAETDPPTVFTSIIESIHRLADTGASTVSS